MPEIAAFRAQQHQMATGCSRLSGALAAHVSTVESARDMDILRAALGDGALNYLGFSYGTKLGATYAQLFPHRVGRFVLDGAMDRLSRHAPAGAPTGRRLPGGARGVRRELRELFGRLLPR